MEDELTPGEEKATMMGFLIGVFIMFIILCCVLSCNSHRLDTVRSNHKIEPTYILTTDGKTVDTVWVYKLGNGK